MSDVIVPGFPKSPSGKVRPRRLYDPTKDPNEWNTGDVAGYFRLCFVQRWPGKGAPGIRVGDLGAIKTRLDWLRDQGVGAAMMKKIIDHIFAHWMTGLPHRFRWRDSRPNLALIEHAGFFQRLVREVQHGPPKVRKDLHDPEEAKKNPAQGWHK